MSAPTEFRISISDQRLGEMISRLRATSWPGDFGNDDGGFGVRESWLREMVDYWVDDYDWRKTEAEMNQYPHYMADIDGISIHFMHIRSPHKDAMPLILTHGWPWSFWDWRDVIKRLLDPANGGPAFHLVVPSLPGFGFSSPLTTAGIGPRKIASMWMRLMTEVLGYQRFAAAAGDWGAMVTADLGHLYPEHVIGIHLHSALLQGVDYSALGESDYAPDELWMHDANMRIIPRAVLHLTGISGHPQTLAYGLADSPVGTAAWLWERRLEWSDCDVGREFLCNLASIYWLTNTIGSSMRIYATHYAGKSVDADSHPTMTSWGLTHSNTPSIPVPTAFAVAPKDAVFIPRKLAEARTNLQRWTVLEKGGHFTSSEVPDAIASEYIAFFGSLAG